MKNWMVVYVVRSTRSDANKRDMTITHFVLADTAEEAIKKVMGDNPSQTGELQQVKLA
jgi:hypothetical protein